jgi:glycosyltransferase involved in cell wall biosynthesis
VDWERRAAIEFGLKWDTIVFAPKGSNQSTIVTSSSPELPVAKNTLTKALNWMALRIHFYRWLRHEEEKYDVILLRYCVHDPFLLNYLLHTKKRVWFVHHTLEGFELNVVNGFVGKIRAVLDAYIGGLSLRHASGFVGVTQEIADYEKLRSGRPDVPTFVYPNGIFFQENKILVDKRSEQLEILFVASRFAPWHGLDRLLKSVVNSQEKFILHVVGEADDSFRVLAKNDARVKFYGRLSSSQIDEIASKCWVALSSFGMDRLKMREACTLKVREYLNQGLPVYANYIEVLPTSFKFFRNDICDIANIVNFAREMFTYTREEVAHSAKPHIDKSIFVRSLYRYMSDR